MQTHYLNQIAAHQMQSRGVDEHVLCHSLIAKHLEQDQDEIEVMLVEGDDEQEYFAIVSDKDGKSHYLNVFARYREVERHPRPEFVRAIFKQLLGVEA